MNDIFKDMQEKVGCEYIFDLFFYRWKVWQKMKHKTPEADASVDTDIVNDATAFLETFFKLYSTVTEKEFAYYVTRNVLELISSDYFYFELVNPTFTKDGKM